MKTKHIVIIAFLSAIIGSIVGPVFWAFTYTYDITTPAGTDSPTLADDRMRETKAAAQERLNVDHYFALTGNEVSDAATGQHRQIEFYDPITKPTNAANKGWVYTKDSASSKVELHWLDEDGNEKQVTTAGALNIVSAELLGKLDNNTYFSAVDAAGTGTVDLIKANASDVVVVPDDTANATTAAPTADASLANKKYVDDQILDFADGVSKAKDTNYTASTSGILVVRSTIIWKYNVDTYVHVKSDSAGTPTTVVGKSGGKCTRADSAGNIIYDTITVPIVNGFQYRVEDVGSGAAVNSIRFYPNE